jgi:hypothetical protein
MTRVKIIETLKLYFKIQDLVCSHTFAKWGERSWQFLDTEYLHSLLVLRRDIFKVGMTCNNAAQKERGLRCNICGTVQAQTNKNNNYLSAHCMGKAGDFTVTGTTAEEARELIRQNKDLLPYPCRIEQDVTWLHFDVFDTQNGEKLVEFKG